MQLHAQERQAIYTRAYEPPRREGPVKGTLQNYFLKISVIMTLRLGPPLPLSLSVIAKVADSS